MCRGSQTSRICHHNIELNRRETRSIATIQIMKSLRDQQNEMRGGLPQTYRKKTELLTENSAGSIIRQKGGQMIQLDV